MFCAGAEKRITRIYEFFCYDLKEKTQLVTETVIFMRYTVLYIELGVYGEVRPKGGFRDETEYRTHRAGADTAAARPFSGGRPYRNGVPWRLGKRGRTVPTHYII